jgi:lysophospholipase L1-like esterase
MNRKNFRAVLLALSMTCLLISGFARAQEEPLSYAKECRTRQGLPNFFLKLKKHRPVTIGYFGGSITAAGSGWREQSAAWLEKEYPGATIHSVNATIGGTGSDLGAFRLKREVLANDPDLVFVEFAVNDFGKDTTRIHEAMEGIVRQIWRHNRRTDICFVYTISAPMIEDIRSYRLPRSAFAMEEIAKHYQIPSVHFGLEVVKELDAGRLIFKGEKPEENGKLYFSHDGVHPYSETGHRLYTKVLGRSLLSMAKAHPAKRLKHALVSPFNAENWENAAMISLNHLTTTSKWELLDSSSNKIARLMEVPILKSTTPGSSIIIKFKGTLVGLYDVVGPGCGQYEAYIDGKKVRDYPRFDKYATYNRKQYFILPPVPDGIHTAEFKVSAEPLDKEKILGDAYTKLNDKSILDESACYVASVLVIGKILQ